MLSATFIDNIYRLAIKIIDG